MIFFLPPDFNVSAVITLQPEDSVVCVTAQNVLMDDTIALEPTFSFELKIGGIEPFDAQRVAIDRDTLEIFIVDDDSEFVGGVVLWVGYVKM